MKIRITGNLRQIADSAWISTMDEIKAKARTNDDVIRVVNLLIDNKHTSPFESVSLSFDFSIDEVFEITNYLENSYSRAKTNDINNSTMTIDLLNFLKTTVENDLFNQKPWQLLEEAHPELAKICQKFALVGSKILTPSVNDLGEHQMKVELINFHDEGDLSLSRATWRLLCPLSIAVQILRHRKLSANMTSGRYRTLRQDLIAPVEDCQNIFDKIGWDLSKYLEFGSTAMIEYAAFMKDAKKAKDEKLISNDEYKRVREFARFILPEGRMTELYITFYLDDFYNNYLPLRDSIHAQKEHIWIAQEMRRVLEQ